MENVKNEEKKQYVSDNVTIEGAIIRSVSTPSTIQKVAQDRGINPQEVFVRVVFSYNNNDYAVSNKLRFLTKSGYKQLLDAQSTKTPLKLTVDRNGGFFYIENDVAVDDLFKEKPVFAKTTVDLTQLI